MTLSLRNGLLALAFVALLIFTLGYGLITFLLVTREGWTAEVGDGPLGSVVLATVAAPVGCLIGFIFVRRAYRKSAAPEVFFFSLFLVALAAESLLLVQAWVILKGLPSYFTALVTRVMWAFRFTGLFLLLSGSLYSFEFAYRKYGNLVLGSIVTGIFLAVTLPLHSTSARNHLLFAVGDAPGVVLVTLLIGALVLVNFLVGSHRPGAPDRAWVRAWTAVSFLAAWGFAIVSGPWATLLGLPGVILVAWKSEQSTVLG